MQLQGGVLVGVGDEYEAMPELDWGAREAIARGVPLQLVRIYHRSQFTEPWTVEQVPALSEIRADALQRLQRAMAHVHRQWAGLTVRANVEEGAPAEVLVKASGDADVTVLGSRHLGPVGGLLLGSVSNAVATRARGPVVVVRNAARVPVVRPAVVVGLDGSPGDDVLHFAFEHAVHHRRSLEAVVCVAEPFDVRLTGHTMGALTDQAGRWLAETLAPWHVKYAGVELRETVTVARAVTGLVDASLGQELLVVGGPALGIASSLGSVTQGVLHHAECPVAVVPDRNAVTR